MQGVYKRLNHGASRGYATGLQCTRKGALRLGLAERQAQKSPLAAGL